MDVTQERILIQETLSDPQKFRVLYRLYFPRIYAYVAARINEKTDVEDTISDIFIKAFKSLRQFTGDSFAAWLFGIARNAIYDFYRRRGHSVTEELSDNYYSDDPLPEAIVVQAEAQARVLRLIHTLPPRRQEIIVLKFFSGLKNHEIAEVLNLDEHSVASHLSRALKDLYERFLVERQAVDE